MLSIDLKDAIDGRTLSPCFSVKLFQLMLKADWANFAKLSSVYPTRALMVRHYKATGEILYIIEED